MKISVITPSYNQAQFLEETLQSVLSQTHPDVELLVLDGGSTDGSVDILERYKGRLWYRSKKDDGQTAAINEGFKQANGEVLTWLNSDDLFYDQDTLARVAARFDQDPALDALFGDFVIIDPTGKVISRKKQVGYDYNCLLYGYCYITPAIFVRRGTLDRIGNLDATFRYIFDWEYYLRLGKNKTRIVSMRHYLFRHRYHAESITVTMPEKQLQEVKRLRATYGYVVNDLHYLHRVRWKFLEYYYRIKRWGLRALLRGQFQIPLSSKWSGLRFRLGD